MFWIGRYNFRK